VEGALSFTRGLFFTKANWAFGSGGIDDFSFLEDFDVAPPLIICEDPAGSFAGTNGGIFGPFVKKLQNGVFEFPVDRARLGFTATGRTIVDVIPAGFPFLTPLDGSSAGLAYFVRDHHDLRF
jgi:hypothetical protein